MHLAQKKGKEEQQDSDEEVSAPSPTPINPVAGSSNPRAASALQDAHLGKRKVRDIETMDSMPSTKRPRTNQTTHTRSKPSVRSNDERGPADPAESRPPNKPLTFHASRVSAQPTQTLPHDLAAQFSPFKCSTPISLLQIPLPAPTSTLQSSVVPLLPPAIIRQSPAKSGYNSTNNQSGSPVRTRQPLSSSLRPLRRSRTEFIDVDLSLEFSGDEQEEQEEEQGAREVETPVVSESGRNGNQGANGDEDSDKTEPDTDTDWDGSETNDDSQIGMDTQDYAMPWRRCLPAIPAPLHDKHHTVPIQRGDKDQVLVPASSSTNSQTAGNSNSQPSTQQSQLRLSYLAEAGPSRKFDPSTCPVESTGPLSPKEREMDPDTSCVPDSQSDISLLGPSSRLNCIPSSTLASGVPESSLSQPGQHAKLEDKPRSQPSQLTDPDFMPGNASFDEYTDPLEFTIGVGSEREVSLESSDEVDRLGRVVHYEDAGYTLRDRERIRRSDSGASTVTDTATLVGDYFEAKEEEIKKEMEEPQESQLTRTEGSQCQPSQPACSESQGSQPSTALVPIQPKSTSVGLHHLRSRADTLSSTHEERKKGLVIAVLDLIAHWLQVKDVKLVHDVWDGLPPHEQTFDRVLRVCLQCDLTAVQVMRRHPNRMAHIRSSDEDEDEGGDGKKPIRFMGLRQRYLVVPDPKRRFPYPKGRDPGHAWVKVICRMLGAMYGFKAQCVHQLWTEAGGDIRKVEKQLEGRKTGWLDLHGLGLGDVPRPWV